MYINTKNLNTQSPSTPYCKYLGISFLPTYLLSILQPSITKESVEYAKSTESVESAESAKSLASV